jgi:hypothetical protein
MNAVVFAAFAVVAMITAVAKAIPRIQRRLAARARAHAQLSAGDADLRDGELATLRGTVAALGEPLESPLTGTPCVAYAATVMRGYPRSRFTRSYEAGREEFGKSEMRSFAIDTGSQRVIVEGASVAIDMPMTPVIPEEPARSMKFANVDNQSAVSAPYEAIVAIGASITVSGRVVLERDVPSDGLYRDEPVKAKLVGTPEHPITIAAR